MSTIDELEAPLRRAHDAVRLSSQGMNFQEFVDACRRDPEHTYHNDAIAYNRAMYERQNR